MSKIAQWINSIGYVINDNTDGSKWAKKHYDKWGKKLQKYYDKLDDINFSPEVNSALKKLCDELPNDIATGLLKKVTAMYKSKGVKTAEDIVREILLVASNFKF